MALKSSKNKTKHILETDKKKMRQCLGPECNKVISTDAYNRYCNSCRVWLNSSGIQVEAPLLNFGGKIDTRNGD